MDARRRSCLTDRTAQCQPLLQIKTTANTTSRQHHCIQAGLNAALWRRQVDAGPTRHSDDESHGQLGPVIEVALVITVNAVEATKRRSGGRTVLGRMTESCASKLDDFLSLKLPAFRPRVDQAATGC